jgi:hypothetical protein
MKKLLVLAISLSICLGVNAQRTTRQSDAKKKDETKTICDSLTLNIDEGYISFRGGQLDANSPVDSIKKYMICAIQDDRQTHTGECSGGLRLVKRGIFFNPAKGFIEFDSTTKATMHFKVFDMTEEDLNDMSGLVQVSDISTPTSDEPSESVFLYPQKYGTLAIWMNIATRKVDRFQFHNKKYDQVYLCVE